MAAPVLCAAEAVDAVDEWVEDVGLDRGRVAWVISTIAGRGCNSWPRPHTYSVFCCPRRISTGYECSPNARSAKAGPRRFRAKTRVVYWKGRSDWAAG